MSSGLSLNRLLNAEHVAEGVRCARCLERRLLGNEEPCVLNSDLRGLGERLPGHHLGERVDRKLWLGGAGDKQSGML